MSYTLKVKVKKLHPDAVLPSYTRHGDVAMDVRSIDERVIPSGERCLIQTGLSFEIPFGYEMQVRARSGLAAKNGIGLVNGTGTIDPNYRGELGIILINHGKEPFVVNKGDRIAQVVFNKIEHTEIEEVDELSETNRGECGFGSSGIK
jgi:dUTP pyrophosphatase